MPGKDEVASIRSTAACGNCRPSAPAEKSESARPLHVGIAPFGMTSLHDAIAATARLAARRNNAHRAVIVLTDGVDNNSRLSPPRGLGHRQFDRRARLHPRRRLTARPPGDGDGRQLRPTPARSAIWPTWPDGRAGSSSSAARPRRRAWRRARSSNELRHQYLIAFEPTGATGWHPLEVRARKSNLVVRARSGYMAGPSPKDSSSQ